MALDETVKLGASQSGSSVKFSYSPTMQRLMSGTLLSDEETLAIMVDAAKLVFDEAQKFVIVDTGALRDTGRIEGIKNASGAPSVVMRWGAADVRYANKQYFDMGIRVISAGNSKGRKEWGIYAYTLNEAKYAERMAENLTKLLKRKGLKAK